VQESAFVPPQRFLFERGTCKRTLQRRCPLVPRLVSIRGRAHLTVYHCPPELLELPRDITMASVAIASLGYRRVLMDLTTLLLPTVEDHVAASSSDPILEVDVRSGRRR